MFIIFAMYPVQIISPAIHSGAGNLSMISPDVLHHTSPTGGLATKAYLGTSRQSDEQAAQASNPGHFKFQWDELGTFAMLLVEALVLSPFNAKYFYDSIEDSFHNAMTGYYMILMNIMILKGQHGDNWESHFLPLVTIQNMLHCVGHFVSRAINWPEDIPFLPWCTRELAIEYHFGAVKQPFRGNPKYKDFLVGTIMTRNG